MTTDVVPLDSTATKLAARLVEVRKERQELERQDAGLRGEEEQLKDALKTTMEDLGLRNFKTVTGDTIFLEARFFLKFEDPEKVREWLDKNGLEDVAPRTINRARLNEVYKDRQAEDKGLPPPEVCEATSLVTVKVRTAGGKPKEGGTI